MTSFIRNSFLEARNRLSEFLSNEGNLHRIEITAGIIVETIRGGGKILTAGNGGSMCDAMHLAEELSGRYRSDRPPLPAIALSDPAHMSCVANDYGFGEVFARQVTALGRDGDVLVLFTTSGNSPNLIRAAEEAKKKKMIVAALLGRGGGKLMHYCDHFIMAPGETSDRIQELHIKIVHILIEAVERTLYPELYRT